MSDIKDAWELLSDVYSKVEGTPWEDIIPIIVIGAVLFLGVKLILIPVGKVILNIYKYVSAKLFIKKQVYEKLSFFDSSDLYYAIKNFVPTRFSRYDPSNNEEPTPEYITLDGEKEPLLLDHFLKYEYNIKYGRKYYLCLGDCGMGKTTFLINLYYQTLKLHKYRCVFISLQEENCIEQIQAIELQPKTILLLDALDENENALINYDEFNKKLERATHNFYRVIITARTNFFETESKEQISNNRSNTSMTDKLSNSRKYYISPFTDEDINKFLRKKYRFKPSKIRKALAIIEKNKNLSVRPLLLRFIDELLKENFSFEYDFQLYEYLFGKWIEREKRSINEELGRGLYEECLLMAKEIYYHWLKNGKIGISIEDIKKHASFVGIEAIQLKGHAFINRTSDGIYKFSHKSYWEFLLAKLAVTDYLFSDELLINNFDRATSFLEEMIKYNERYDTQQDLNFCIGKADYLLKYKKPEDAEKLYEHVINNCAESDPLYLYALIKMADCYWRQIKYKSAIRVLFIAKNLISNAVLDINNIILYSKFAIAFSKYCREYHVLDGQIFLEKIIEFLEKNAMMNYNLLSCYDAYTYCCANYKDKQALIEKMERIVKIYFENDQYARYLYLNSISWKTLYKNILDNLTQQIRHYTRFKDMYDLINLNCDLAISMYSYYHDQGTFMEHQDIAIDYFSDAFDICSLIYQDNDHVILKNPYMVIIQRKLVTAFSFISARKLSELVDPILNYSETHNLNDEMSMFCCKLLIKEGDDKLDSFENCEKNLLLAAELAKNNSYQTANIYWSLFVLYDNNGQKDIGQQYLEKAYKLAIAKTEINMTPLYCGILRVTLEFYEGHVDRENIVQLLMEAIPRIYGSDNRKKSVYQALRRYLAKTGDKRLLDVCAELLQLELDYDTMEDFFDICDKFNVREKFVVTLKTILLEKESLSLEESSSLEKFLKQKKTAFDSNTLNYFGTIINSVKRSANNSSFSNLIDVSTQKVENNEQLDEATYGSHSSKFSGDIAISRTDADDYFDLQKELEKKFDELFGPLEEHETTTREEQDDLDNLIALNDEEGNEVKFQFLDLIEYNGEEFVVLLPTEDEEIGEVVILKLEDNDGDEESYVSVDDEQTLSNVFDIFKKKFSNEFDFVS